MKKNFSMKINKRTAWATLALMMATAGMCSCSSNDTEDKPLSNEDNKPIELTLTRAEQDLVNESNDFAFNLMRQVSTPPTDGQKEKSIILSPISITYALGMLNNGAAGETQQQINQVLGFGETGADGINDFCRKMLTAAPSLDKLTKVMIANTLFINKNYNILPDFLQKAKRYYDAEPETRDFHDGKTLDVINQWASDHTEEMITKVLDPDSFSPYAVSYLLNAIYFKGAWAQKFSKDDTRDEAFEGAGKKVPMMHQEHEFGYTEDELCQVLNLPYGNGSYTMTILLPREGKTTDDVLQKLDKENWKRYLLTYPAIVDVKLPRFESNTDQNLNEIMTKLGMPLAFTDFAEFPFFCDQPTKIGMMKQVARIKLNEEGTEAAAVTVIGMIETTSTNHEPRRIEFHATRPFLYIISEQQSGAIFFIGKYVGD